MINLLEIDNINFSNAVNRRNYAVNHSDIYREWTDINQRKHREVIRRQIQGTMQLIFHVDTVGGFTTQSGQIMTTQDNALLTVQDSVEGTWKDWLLVTTGGTVYHSIKVYVESLDDYITLDGFISYTARAIRMNEDCDEAVGIIVVDCEIVER
jgi:hypothetical protein